MPHRRFRADVFPAKPFSGDKCDSIKRDRRGQRDQIIGLCVGEIVTFSSVGWDASQHFLFSVLEFVTVPFRTGSPIFCVLSKFEISMK